VRRLLAIGTVLAAAAALPVFAVGAGDDGGAYRVRAIFMNAFSVIPGEDVKIAGVKVGQIESLDVTPDKKAAVVLRIDEPGFDDFREDAECSIRPQSLIGEKFVECSPTQPRPENAQAPAPLKRIEQGEGKGQYLLPVEQTNRPVDIDLLNNVLRLPYRQRLAIIINELGTGLAGRGQDLRQAIRNANPALKETDKVLEILGEQNRVLADLARDSDEIMRPLARDRGRVASFVDTAGEVAEASAEKDRALEQNIAKLPAFLRELKPTMTRLGALSDEMTPVLADLGDAAPDISRFILNLGPFSKAGIPAFETLGDAADVGRDALVKSKPIVEDLGRLGREGKPLANDLEALLTSLKTSGGIERFMDYIFYQMAAINGYDSLGHYLRAGLIVNICSTYAITEDAACSARFQKPAEDAGSARLASMGSSTGQAWNDPRRSPTLRRTDAVLRGLDPDRIGAGTAETAAQPAPADPSTSLLDYLLGG